MNAPETTIKISVDTSEVDAAIEKLERLLPLLKEANEAAALRDICNHCGHKPFQGCPDPDCKIGPKRKPYQNLEE